jgi:nucleotide-binding universal stress UspA family protein
MSHEIKSILAMLNRPTDMAAILGWANRITKDIDAAADGVFLKFDAVADSALFVDGIGYLASDIAVREIAEASARAEEVAREEFECAAKRGARSRLGSLKVISNGSRSELAKLSRLYDVALTHLPEGPTFVADESLLAELLLEGGVPVFAAPRSTLCDAPLQSALVAWDASLEASRALRAALPFIKECRSVHLRSIHKKEQRDVDLKGLSQYLLRHGVEADIGAVEEDQKGAGASILAEADRLAVDFIVMGAFGHKPWREQLFGGATHDVVRCSRKPLMLAH